MANPKRAIPIKNVQQTSQPKTETFKFSDTTVVICILAITAVVFSNSVFNDFIVNWDDDGYIISNPLIREFSLHGLKIIFTVPHLDNYHPLTTLSNAIELYLFGLNPTPYHFFNLLLHLLNTFLVFRFIRSLSRRVEIAAITALLFGIHPMHVESVAWISERKDVLYACFYLGSLIFYLRYINHKKPIHFCLSLLLFVGSLLSKPAAVVLAPTLFLLDYYTGRKIDVKLVLEKIPFFALSLFFGILAMHIQQSSGSTNLAPHFPAADKVFLVSYALAFYLIKAVAPFGLSALHLYPVSQALSWVYYAAPLVLVISIWAIYKSGKYRKDVLFGALFFLINIILIIQIVPVGRAIVGERYTYIPHIGLFFILGTFYCRVMDGDVANAVKIKPYLQPVIAGFVLLLCVITWNRNTDWKDSHTLFTKAIETNPGDYYGYFARAAGEVMMEDKPAALADFSEAIRVNPKYSDAFYSRGVLREKTDPAAALADYTEAIRLKPDNDKAFYNRGTLKIFSNDYTGALADLDSSIRINKKYAEAYCNRGAVKVNLGKVTEAVADYDTALIISPGLANAWFNRGNAEHTLNDNTKACDDWRKARQLGYAEAQKQIGLYCK